MDADFNAETRNRNRPKAGAIGPAVHWPCGSALFKDDGNDRGGLDAPDANWDHRPRILVADDEPDILDLIVILLNSDKYRVLAAGDGEQALELAISKRPDLAILDVKMPSLDGLEVTRRIRSNRSTIQMPVIMLSAFADDAHITSSFAAGADSHIVKPRFNQLISEIEAFLGHSSIKAA